MVPTRLKTRMTDVTKTQPREDRQAERTQAAGERTGRRREGRQAERRQADGEKADRRRRTETQTDRDRRTETDW